MIKFFKKIRKKLLSDGIFGKYIKYAFGEIVLVVIGIMIAVSINNWNEDRKSKITSLEIHETLLETLSQDSVKIDRIINLQSRCLAAKIKILSSKLDPSFIMNNNLLSHIMWGSLSFFPNAGPYNSIISNDQMELIYSNDLRTALINLYDYQYKRYENIDAIIDNKFQNRIFSVIDKKMTKYSLDSISKDEKLIRSLDPILIDKHYSELQSELKDTYRIMNTGYMLLLEIQESINEIIINLRGELEN